MEELISIVVPIYKVEEYIEECIESIRNQTYKNLEIILVDDQSPDNCGKICNEYEKKDNRIKVIHKKNGGLSDARNVGIDIAKGAYIAFIDSDDYVANDYISNLYQICKRNGCSIAQCSYIEFQKEKTEEKPERSKIRILDSVQALLQQENEGIVINIAWNKLYKTELFNDVRYPKGRIHEDEATTYKLVYKAGKIAITNQRLYYYRQRDNSIMKEKYNIRRLDYIKALEERLQFYKDKNEEKLYYYTLHIYMLTLRGTYFLVEKYIENPAEICKEIIIKYKRSSKELIINKQENIYESIKIILFMIFPSVYRRKFWRKKEKQNER